MNEKAPQEDMVQEFILVTGELVFHEQDKPETLNAVRCNGMLVQATRNIGMHALGKMQQVLQANFLKKIPPEQAPIIVDVVITNITYLGNMTKAEFEKTPAPLRERPTVTPTGDALDQAVAAAGGPANG